LLTKYSKYADIAELRVDCLKPDERFLIRNFPQLADIPVILTIRRDIDGGYFNSGEGARINLMAKGLAFADADRRRNYAYVDIEEDLNVPNLEEAARTFGTRIIRSYHDRKNTGIDLSAKICSMQRSGDEIVKIAVNVNSTADVINLLEAGKGIAKQDKILIAMGHYGVYSRILSEQFGSYLCYSSILEEPDAIPAAPGQIDIRELVNLYNFRNIKKETKIFGIVGNPLTATSSPFFFNTIFNMEGINAVYVPFPSDSLDDFFKLAEELNVSGLTITVPYKEKIISMLNEKSLEVEAIGVCNSIKRSQNGWYGINTDVQGFSGTLLEFLNRQNLKRMRATIIGAGGAAKSAAFELHRLGAKALILNRTEHKARSIAVPYEFAWNCLDKHGMEMMNKYRDIIIQASSAGMTGSDCEDPAPMYNFHGKEQVMDIVSNPKITHFLKRASDAGCKIINGYDMLIRQAQYQYLHFIGREFPRHLLSRVHLEKE